MKSKTKEKSSEDIGFYEVTEAKEPSGLIFRKSFYSSDDEKPDYRTYSALADCGCDDRH